MQASNSSTSSRWRRYCGQLTRYPELGFSLDCSCMHRDAIAEKLAPQIARAWKDCDALESGAIANPDEGRMVGHYWLRNSSLAPTAEIREAIEQTLRQIETFVSDIHAGKIVSARGIAFRHVLLIGIGGSALGPQLVADALMAADAPMKISFLDNTDPDGIDRTLGALAEVLDEVLVLVISKSGGTKETRNGMLEAENFFAQRGVPFAPQAVAVTGAGSRLYEYSENWLARFPMWDWVGGRTSVMSAVGLLPAALIGVDIRRFLEGAASMDARTRVAQLEENAAMQLALQWHAAGEGRGGKDMVILPYCDRLVLLSKYLQQLVMESLGKERDLDGNIVHQGIAVYGNKGSTDQHAFVQQLRDGVDNFFVTFIEARRSARTSSIEVDSGMTTGDYLQGFLRGTREALRESGRESMTVSIDQLSAQSLGALIALFERAVTFYASLVHINAYHQPGVEAGKKAAGVFLEVMNRVRDALEGAPGKGYGASDLAQQLGLDEERVYHALQHLAATRPFISQEEGGNPHLDRFACSQ